MNELLEELKFFNKEIGFYDDWENFFMDLADVRDKEILERPYFLNGPNCDKEGTLNKLKSLLAQHEPFKTNSEEETESNFTDDVSKSSQEEEQEEIGSFYGSCSHCETWEEISSMKIKFGGNLPAIKISRESSCPKHQVDPTNLHNFIEDDDCYDKKCTRETVTGIYALSDIFQIPEENSYLFEEAVTSLRSRLDNLDSYDDINILKDIIIDVEKIISLSPFYKKDHVYSHLYTDKLRSGFLITNRTSENKAQDILFLVSDLLDLPVAAEVEMLQCLIPVLTPILKYIDTIRYSRSLFFYSHIKIYLEALEIIYKTYCKHQTLITSMEQEDVSLEFQKIADSIAFLKTIDKRMCFLDADSDISD